ncbi:hypothetical protein Bca52824_090557 [Brassica carinata]|uniref:F-box domain-containing protein n=1 Tax=Brassica carinata TaxID=52824 RepID=A0A8X7NYH9_BRACI|nr:hypothetical protein Bca52824_090557 [Brassica carinata]
MKKKLNPHSHKYLIGDASKSWSDLPFDLLNLVFESLSFADFQRAKSVCSSWRSSSRQCVPKNHIPWVLRFPQNNENSSCMLSNPEEKDKLYKTQDLGLEFAKSSCMKTYGSWLLMQNLQSNLFIVNLFTGERINLPPVKSQFGMTKIQSPVFWIDEKTKDHVVSWARSKKCVVYSKTGDNSWNKIPKTSGCLDMVYKDHKLYFSINWWRTVATNIIVTVTGDVLEVVKMWEPRCRSWFFFHSLGDEAMLLDLGITVLANDNDGISRNSIYFSDCKNANNVFLFNLKTWKMEKLHKFDCSSVQLSSSRWVFTK